MNFCFVEQARRNGENGAERAEVEGPKCSMGAPVRAPGGEKEGKILERNEEKWPVPVAAPHEVKETEKEGKRGNALFLSECDK